MAGRLVVLNDEEVRNFTKDLRTRKRREKKTLHGFKEFLATCNEKKEMKCTNTVDLQ